MEQAQFEELKAGQAEVLKKVRELEMILAGDGLKGETGVMGYQKRMLEDLYGTPQERKDSILHRVSELEDGDKRRKWITTGMAIGAGGSAGGIIGLLVKIFSH
jgi:hypothetical protein